MGLKSEASSLESDSERMDVGGQEVSGVRAGQEVHWL